MLRHIVMWSLKESAGGRSKEENAALVKSGLESLSGRIEALRRIEVHLNEIPGPDAFDVVLIADFDDREGLTAYLDHPLHHEVGNFVGSVRLERKSVDYFL